MGTSGRSRLVRSAWRFPFDRRERRRTASTRSPRPALHALRTAFVSSIVSYCFLYSSCPRLGPDPCLGATKVVDIRALVQGRKRLSSRSRHLSELEGRRPGLNVPATCLGHALNMLEPGDVMGTPGSIIPWRQPRREGYGSAHCIYRTLHFSLRPARIACAQAYWPRLSGC